MEPEKEKETNTHGGGQVDLVLHSRLEAKLVCKEEEAQLLSMLCLQYKFHH